ncbi:MAG: PH domain-containing protein, partial [Chloroflexota bacterium]
MGNIFQVIALLVFTLSAAFLFIKLTNADLGPSFLLYLLSALVTAIPVPFLGYRLYALNRSFYVLERDGVRLQWGFRIEDIPMTDVLWVRLAEDLPYPITLPRPWWPGALVGSRKQRDDSQIEFFAVDAENLLLIGT